MVAICKDALTPEVLSAVGRLEEHDHAWDGLVPSDEQLRRRVGLPRRSAPPAPVHRPGARRAVARLERPAHDTVPPGRRRRRGACAPGPPGPRGRAAVAPAAAGRFRAAVDPRRSAAAPAVDAARSAAQRPATVGDQLAGVGPARGGRGGADLVRPPRPGRSGGRVDPDRHRRPVAGGAAGPVVASRRVGGVVVGARGVGVRRGLRGDLRGRSELALRDAGRGAVLLRRRRPGGAARIDLVDAEVRTGHAPVVGGVLHRRGGAPGLAGPGVLARGTRAAARSDP